MIAITHKNTTLRKAIAKAEVLVGSDETIAAIRTKTVPKGNVFESARVAGLFAVKNTSSAIPDCHPMPIEFTRLDFNISDRKIEVLCEVHTIYRTGVEVEAMHGASIAALTIYDMLKPIDKSIEITGIRLISKTGGKSDGPQRIAGEKTAAVIVCSDSVYNGTAKDSAGEYIAEKLKEFGFSIGEKIVVPDDEEFIRLKVQGKIEDGASIVILTGGTGVSPRDKTPEAVRKLIDREIPGISETIRNYGQQRMPFSMLSRSVAGLASNTLIITLPGSLKAVKEGMSAIFPGILHVFPMMERERH